MGLIDYDPFIVRLADTEAECKNKKLNNAALGKWSKAQVRSGAFWIEMWNERLQNWVEI